ncbi:MAG: glycerate kinase [Chloroflexi bacterium]|nr:glycerate kinase [Chloroflexota bacterium]
MKVIVAPQSFKGTASAAVVADAMCRGVLLAMPHAEVVSIPIADGGSGTVEALVTATGGRYVSSPTSDPLGRPITARWGVLGDNDTAVIESSAASGLSLLEPSERDPTKTTTRGTGTLVRAALDAGYRRILIGLGDSATNDAGVGMAQALGIRALDGGDHDLPDGGAALLRLHSFDMTGVHPSLSASTITVLCDVTNPLCGPEGASAIFGPQKGASPQQVSLLDSALSRFSDVVEARLGCSVRDMPGAGAAGGLGAGLVAFCGAVLRPGFEVVSDTVHLRESLAGADLVLMGEGRIDAQTAGGKGVSGVAALSKRSGVPLVAAIVGRNEIGATEAASLGIDAVFSLTPLPNGAIADPDATPRLIEATTARAVASLLKGGNNDA